MTIQMKTRKLTWAIVMGTVFCCAVPARAVPLIGAGSNLPIPTTNPSWPPGQSAVRTVSGTAFTGTWTAPAHSDWVGNYNATGPVPSSMSVGSVKYDFSSLPLGYLPAGTFFIFGDVDRGSTLGERFDIKGIDSAGNVLGTPWLDEPYAVTGVPGGGGSSIVSGDMPAWSWDDPASPQTYVINGSGVSTGNPSVSFALVSNQPLHAMQLNKRTTHNGFGLAAPVVPEPCGLVIASLGALLLVSRRVGHCNGV